MNIGILAYHSACNYGANLQVLSTVGYLKRNGHNPIVINYETDDFSINKITAHANADGGDMKCDWMIHEITFPTNIIENAKKLINDNSDNEGMSSDDPMSANPYACGVHDGILDVMSALGVDVQETFDTDYYN